MVLIVLRVDVDTLRDTRGGVPNLARMLRKYEAGAIFLFSLGPDHTGWALCRAFRPGFLEKVSHTSVIGRYGFRTPMYDVLLSGPDIGRKAAAEMRAIGEADFETGIHTQDHVLWRNNVCQRDTDWAARQVTAAHARFIQVLGKPPVTHGATGQQMNDHTFRQIDNWGVAYVSDDRGTHPYILNVDGRMLNHMRLPATLPTLDELIGVEDITLDDVARHTLKMTEPDRDQIFTLHTELEGQELAPIFRELLRGWRAQGHRLGSMDDYCVVLDRSTLPAQSVTQGEVAGRSGSLTVQPA